MTAWAPCGARAVVVTTKVVIITGSPGSGYALGKEIADSGQLSIARATSPLSPGAGPATRTCPKQSSLIWKIFEFISEQRPWPWQRLASMDSGTCEPFSEHRRLHAFLHKD